MIQRIQSLYLLATMLILSILFFVPFASMQLGGLEVSMSVSKFYPDTFIFTKYPYIFWGLTLLTAGVILLSGFALLSYKNRKRQIKLVSASFFVNILLVGSLFFSVEFLAPKLYTQANGIEYLWSTYIPLLAMLLISMALRAIRKDEALIRSADRLR
ncbi:MAG: DUF4293 domain-containing protein [Bacteroidales bacterium]